MKMVFFNRLTAQFFVYPLLLIFNIGVFYYISVTVVLHKITKLKK